MNRPWPILTAIALAVLATPACQKARIEKEQALIQELTAKVPGLQTQAEAEHERLAKLKAAWVSLTYQLKAAEKRIEEAQRALARSWGGHAPSMQSKAADLPEDLRAELAAAQKKFAHASQEQTFKKAIKKNDMDTLAGLLTGWEEDAGYAMPDDATPDPAEDDPGECPCEPTQEVTCIPIADSWSQALCSIWDPSGKSTGLLLGTPDGVLRLWEVKGSNRGGYRLVRALGQKLLVLEALNKDKRPTRLVVLGLALTKLNTHLRLRLSSRGKKAQVIFADGKQGPLGFVYALAGKLTLVQVDPTDGAYEINGGDRVCKLITEAEAGWPAAMQKLCPKGG
jgi:hypothetical protein